MSKSQPTNNRKMNMNAIDFCFWLQGCFEINGEAELTKEQVQVIRNHLNLVFKHEIDPLRESQRPAQIAPYYAPNIPGVGNANIADC